MNRGKVAIALVLVSITCIGYVEIYYDGDTSFEFVDFVKNTKPFASWAQEPEERKSCLHTKGN